MAAYLPTPLLASILLLVISPAIADPVLLCNPWVNVTGDVNQIDICNEPSFDAAVSVSDSKMLLFKGTHMWLLDLLNYKVSPPLANCILQSCLGDHLPMNAYYVWNQHENYKLHKNRICMHGAGEICQFSVDLRPTSNDIFYRTASTSAPFAIWNGTSEQGLCQQNVQGANENNIIEIVLIQKNFYQPKGAQHVRLMGRHFIAAVSYTPNHYDPNMVFLKVELFKLYQEVERVQTEDVSPLAALPVNQGDGSIAAEPKRNQIENVNTFAVLPTGELMVFFADHFCHINYYDLECKRRSTSVLIGCAMHAEDVSRNQLYIAPDRVNTSQSPATLAGGTSTGAINDIASSLKPQSSTPPTTTVSTREVVNNGSNSSSVSTLHTAGRDTTATVPMPVTSPPSSTSETSSASLSVRLSNSTFVRATTLPAPSPLPTQTTMSGDTDRTSFSSATAATLGTGTTNSHQSTSSTPYDIDFLFRKRDAFKRSLAHDPTERSFGNLRRHFVLLQIGFVSLKDIALRAFKYFILSFAVTNLLAVMVLSLVHRYRKIDFAVLIYIYNLRLGRELYEF